MQINNINIKRNYLLVFLVLASSGIPNFTGLEFLNIFLFLYALIIIIYKGFNKDPQAFLIIFLFFLIELFQHYLHGSYSYRTSVGTFIKLTAAYFIVKLVREKFISYYINILYVFSLISFVFYSLTFVPGFTDIIVNQIAPYFESTSSDLDEFYKTSPSIILYTFDPIAMKDYRNSGPFWEPGAFAVYLIIALMFNIVKKGYLLEKKNIVFIIALITTFSTAGYIAFFILMSGYFLFNKGFSQKLILIIFVFASLSIYTNTTFLKEKVINNLSIAEESTSSRFGSALADYRLFEQSPIVGWGRGPMRYGGKVSLFGKDEHRNNGAFILLATYGLFGFLLYFFLLYKSLKNINNFFLFKKRFALVSLSTILILGFSQDLFFKPFFLCFLFLFLVIRSNKTNYKFY